MPGEFRGLPLAAVHPPLLAWVRVGDARGRVGERHDPSLVAKARQASSAELSFESTSTACLREELRGMRGRGAGAVDGRRRRPWPEFEIASISGELSLRRVELRREQAPEATTSLLGVSRHHRVIKRIGVKMPVRLLSYLINEKV